MNDILFADRACLDQKIARIRESGSDQLCVVADWDRTLTRAWTDEGEDTTSYLAIVQGGYLGDDYRKEMDQLYAQYRPIEVSQTLSVEERTRAMHDWWAAAFALMQKYGLVAEVIEDVARRDLMQMRDGAGDFFKQLNDFNVPLLIVSAGIGNIISAFLEARARYTANVKVMANQLIFARDGKIQGFDEPVVHTLNKQVDQDDLVGKKNVLLLGDTLEDAHMVDGLDIDQVIRVGFLNGEISRYCEAYLKVYDVLICEDRDMGFVNCLLKDLLQP